MDALAQYYLAQLPTALGKTKKDIKKHNLDFFSPPDAIAPPDVYLHLPDQSILRHSSTCVSIWDKPLRIEKPGLFGSFYRQPVVLYHYTSRQAFETITSENCLFVSTSLGTDCDFGVGQYATQKPPHLFSSAFEILLNNYPRATAKFDRGHPSFPSKDRVAFCIPVIVELDWTPALPLTDPDGPRGAVIEAHDRYGPFDALHHDIWVVCSIKSEGLRHLDQPSVSLFKAADQNQVDVVTNILEADSSLVHLTDGGGTVLHRASEKGCAQVVKALLAHDASVDEADCMGDTPLMLSVSSSVEVTKLLLSSKADTEFADSDGTTPLMVAARKLNADGVEALVQAQACVNTCGSSGGPALLMAVDTIQRELCLTSSKEIKKMQLQAFKGVASSLISHGASMNVADESGRTAAIATAGRPLQNYLLALVKAHLNESDSVASGSDGSESDASVPQEM